MQGTKLSKNTGTKVTDPKLLQATVNQNYGHTLYAWTLNSLKAQDMKENDNLKVWHHNESCFAYTNIKIMLPCYSHKMVNPSLLPNSCVEKIRWISFLARIFLTFLHELSPVFSKEAVNTVSTQRKPTRMKYWHMFHIFNVLLIHRNM